MVNDGLIVDLYNLVLVVCLAWFSNVGDLDKSAKSTAFNRLLSVYSLIVSMDSLSRLPSEPYSFIYMVSIVAYFMVVVCEPCLTVYCIYYIDKWMTADWAKTKPWICSLGGYAFINALVVTFDRVFNIGIIYSYSEATGEFIRGSLYNARYISILVSYLCLDLFIFLNKNRLGSTYRKVLLTFPLVPLAFGLIETVSAGIKTSFIGFVIGFLVLYIYLQVRNSAEDPLTGIANRKQFDVALEDKIKFCSESNTFSVIMFDIDYFKTINDTYGHDEGDVALVTIANLVQECLRRNNDVFARYGGDEFCVLLGISNQRDLLTVVKRIHDRLTGYNATSNKPYALSVSMGYAVYNPRDNMDNQQFMHYIDDLMYADKTKRHKKLKEEGIESIRESGITGILNKE